MSRHALTSALLAGALAACATAPAPSPAPAPGPASAPASGERARPAAPAAPVDLATALRRAGQPDAPTLEAVQRALGPTEVGRSDGVGAVLTYRYARCALVLFFTQDAAGAYRLSLAEASRRTANDPRLSVAECAAEAGAPAP